MARWSGTGCAYFRHGVVCLSLEISLGMLTFLERPVAMRHLLYWMNRLRKDTRGEVFVEYILLLTIVGIGVIVGLGVLRSALVEELVELATAILSISATTAP